MFSLFLNTPLSAISVQIPSLLVHHVTLQTTEILVKDVVSQTTSFSVPFMPIPSHPIHENLFLPLRYPSPQSSSLSMTLVHLPFPPTYQSHSLSLNDRQTEKAMGLNRINRENHASNEEWISDTVDLLSRRSLFSHRSNLTKSRRRVSS